MCSQGRLCSGFPSNAIIFQRFLTVDIFRRLHMDEIGPSGFSIAENSSHRLFINFIKLRRLSSKETNFHALHLY